MKIYSFTAADYYVIISYLLLLPSVGFLMKKLCGNSRDYLIGGNKIPWWLAGASVFMMSFSAWTFTGAAGFAYRYGVAIILIFSFNALGYLLAGTFVAAKLRQTRLVTYGQIIYERFGRLSEQIFIWPQFFKMMLGGAVWLLGLSTFVSVTFGVPIQLPILLAGSVILIYSTISGSWAVMTTDFLQSVILMVLSIVIASLTLLKVGGVGEMISQMPADHLSVLSDKHTWLWFIAYCTQTCFLQNSIIGANKFLAVRDGKAARKAAYVAAVLFILGPIIWFIPPLAATFLFPDIGRIFGGLNSPSDGAYALMGLNLLPSGLIGLMVMVIFGATLSSMDTAINVNSGILSLNVYKPLVRPAADEREMLIAARVFNVLCGGLVTMTAYFLSTIPLNLFDLMLLTLSVLGFPMAVPCVLVYFFRKASPWAAPCTVLIGCGYSLLAAINKWGLPVQIFGTALIGTAVFTVATLFWNRNTDEVKHSIEKFYIKMDLPVDFATEVGGSENTRQLVLVGILSMTIGIVLAGVVFFPNGPRERIIVGVTSFSIFLVGLLLYRMGRKDDSGVADDACQPD